MKNILAMTVVAATLGMSTGVANAQNWAGFYGGVTLGQSDIDSTWTDIDYDWVGYNTKVGTYGDKSFALGLQAGYNWQAGDIVYGIAGGVTYQNVSNTTFEFSDVYIDNSLSFTADLRGVLGYSFGKVLPYITAGAAISDLEHSWHEINDTADSWPDFSNKFGFVYGAGVEFAITPKVSIGAQWLRYDFGDKTSTNPFGYRMKVETEMDRYSATINYRF